MKPRVTKLATQGIAFTFMAAAAIWVSFWITGFFHNFYHDDFSPPPEPGADTSQVLAPAHTFGDALDAIEWVESKGYTRAVGDLKNRVYRAVGSFQLWKIYIDDYNRIEELNGMPHRATYEDRWNRIASRKITAVVTSHYANHDWRDKPHTQLQWIETAVRAHKCPPERNKPSTKAYWLRVKARMDKDGQ